MSFTGLLCRRSLCFFSKNTPRIIKHNDVMVNQAVLQYSTHSNKLQLTIENAFDDENKKRVQEFSLKPARTHEEHRNDSAILIPLCMINNQPSVIFTLRSTSLKRHRGEVSFPGGRRDDSDCDLAYTAVRETWEELGLPKENIDVWGSLLPIANKSTGKSFTLPILGYCGHIEVNKLTPNSDEVEDVFTRSLESLINKDNIRYTQWRAGYTMPVFIGGKHRIWGLTAVALHRVLTVLVPGLYTNKVRHNS